MEYSINKRKIYRFFDIRIRRLSILLALLTGIVGSRDMAAEQLRASVIKINITPDDSKTLIGYGPRKSSGIYNPIFHRILCLDDGERQVFVVSSEFCAISPSVYREITDTLSEEYGIDRVDVWWTITHTHSAPEVGPPGMAGAFLGERFEHSYDKAYTDYVKRTFVEGVVQARKDLEPARLGVGWGYSRANINRRAKTASGKIRLGMNPDGEVDRRIGLLRVNFLTGEPLALLANYAIHGTVLGAQSTLISGDAPGVVSDYVEKQLGAPMLFVNGAAGNLAPIYSVYPNPQSGHLDEFSVLLGEPIVEAARAISADRSEIVMKPGEIIVESPERDGLEWPEDLAEFHSTDVDGVDVVRLPVRFLEIDNDIAIWGAPIELFCEISNEIRERSPFPNTFYFGYSNGWLGYLMTEREYGRGGYEARVTPFKVSAERDLKEAVGNYLKKAKEK